MPVETQDLLPEVVEVITQPDLQEVLANIHNDAITDSMKYVLSAIQATTGE